MILAKHFSVFNSFNKTKKSSFFLFSDYLFVPLQPNQQTNNVLIEKHIVLEDIDPVLFFGTGNTHLQMLRALYPKLRIVARDNVIRVLGDEEQMASFELATEKIRQHVVRFNSLKEEDLLDIVKGHRTRDEIPEGVVCYTMSGRAVKARSENQQKLIEAYEQNDMVFAVGPAGTGKTYLSIALAVKALKEKTAKKIILSRPAVEAGEKLGFLPGDMKEKIDPYLQPLYDALEDMLPQVKLQELMEHHIIQIAPLAFMRGRTLSDAVVILDEAQNTSPQQIRMFLTRMGWNTKMIITGDMTQIDLPRSQKSGLVEAMKILNGVEGIGFVELTRKDIVRHKLVTRIVNAFENYDKKYDNDESINKDRL
jgi:phosphate starvation-inducible PhoH-like protein